jgi:RimJ/RimL family protein N-acetyltransferase
MHIRVAKVDPAEIMHFRRKFLEEQSIQFILDKAYGYGWADTYAFFIGEHQAGYGSIWGKDHRVDRDTIFEFYLEPVHRRYTDDVFLHWLSLNLARFIEVQTNDSSLGPLFFKYASDIKAEAILFHDSHTTDLGIPGAWFTRKSPRESSGADDGDFMVMHGDEVVATGGLMLNYNFPYADIYMNVAESFRGKGFGAFIVQELKKHAYAMGRVPSARCNINNAVSRATLLKAGFSICGYRLAGNLPSPQR